MNHLFDIQYAVRLLTKKLSFTLLTIAVLAGGLGLSIFTYSFMSTLIYKGLPFENGKSIVRIFSKYQGFRSLIDAADYDRIHSKVNTLENIGVFEGRELVISNDQGLNGRQISAAYTDWNVFELSKTKPVLGRGFVPEDAWMGAEPVVVIGYKVWRNHFAQRVDIIGERINVNGVLTQIVGVMPEGYEFPIVARAWLPIKADHSTTLKYDERYLNVYARVKEGVAWEQVNAELDTLIKQLRSKDADNIKQDLADSAYIVDFAKAQMGDEQEALLVFSIINFAAISILILACINVGNLLLSRANERIKEISIRMALGAPRGRLIIQMMWESIVICVIGALLGLLLAGWGLDFITQWYDVNLEANKPFWWVWSLGSESIIPALFFTVCSILITGCVTAWHASQCNFNVLLNDGAHGSVGMRAGKLSYLLVIAEVVIISVLLYLGLVTIMVCMKLANLVSSAEVENILLAKMTLPEEQYGDRNKVLNYYSHLNLELIQNDEIENVLIEKPLGELPYAHKGVEYLSRDDYPVTRVKAVMGSLDLLGLNLISGRALDQSDNAEGLKSAIVSQSFANKQWPDMPALGQLVRIMSGENAGEWRTVVGVVGDIDTNTLISKDSSAFVIYIPIRQLPDELLIGQNYDVVFKFNNAANQARSAFYYILNKIDPQVFIHRVTDLAENLKLMNISAVFSAKLMLQFALFSMLVAICGIYGLTQNAIIQGTREIGIRRALGASDARVTRFFLLKGSKQLLIGLSIGFVIAAAMTMLVSQFLLINVVIYIVSMLSVIAAISIIVLLAIYIPITHAIKAEPNVALHYE